MSRKSFVGIALLASLGPIAGCWRADVSPPARPRSAGMTIRATGPSAASSSLVEPNQAIPATTIDFEGATGNVRVTIEVDAGSGPPTLNDVLFRAEGAGKLTLSQERPGPDRKVGRLVVTCRSAGEESSAELDSGLWFSDSDALVAVEPSISTKPSKLTEGTEILLARYSAIAGHRTVRMGWKAVFSREATAPRVKAGMKPAG